MYPALSRSNVLILLFYLGFACLMPGQVLLTADGVTPAYTRINSVLHASPENPDCSHTIFGPHITQIPDAVLGKYVFVFNIHVTPDNDRCSAFDRQRLEIKTEGNSSTPNYLKGFLNDSVTFRWQFQLPAGFQPSYSFTHIHQIKAYDGDAGSPIMTLTPRFGNPNTMQLINVDSTGKTTTLLNIPLEPFLGTWVEAYEKITYSHNGQYSLVITRLSDGATLLNYSNNNLDLWRTGTTVVRPKWGIYRSLNNAQQLRDEQVRYSQYCLAKGTDDCASSQELPDFTLTASAPATNTAPGGSISYDLTLAALRGFGQNVTLSLAGKKTPANPAGASDDLNLTGLPAGSTAAFSPGAVAGGSGASVLTVTTTTATPPGSYSLIISAISADGITTHTATVPLVVTGVPGDVNGDGVVDCSDLALVRSSFSKSVGAAGYNPSADFNGDGIVDIQDLALITHLLPAGTTCQ